MHDPFEQFERSRLGLAIPLLLFVVGAIPTAYAMRALIRIEAKNLVDVRADLQPAGDANDREELPNDPSRNHQDIAVP